MFSAINRLQQWFKRHPLLSKWAWFIGLYCASLIVYGFVEWGLHALVH